MIDIKDMEAEVGAKHILNLLYEKTPYAVVKYEYHGSGDSLDNDEVWFFETVEDYEGENRLEADKVACPGDIQQMVVDFGYGVTETHHAGWENNEGGHGHVVYWVRPPAGEQPRIVQNHWDYVQEEHHGGEHVY